MKGLVTRWPAKLVAVVFALLAAAQASACPVCYGESDSGFLDGARLAIVFMGALTYVLIGGGLAAFFALRRRVRQQEDPQRGLHLVPPQTPTPSS